jgi:hypothetical protein
MRNLPAHQQHQEKAEQQKAERGKSVLDANDLVVGGKNVLAPEARLVMFMAMISVTVMVIQLATIRRKLLNRIVHNFSIMTHDEIIMTKDWPSPTDELARFSAYSLMDVEAVQTPRLTDSDFGFRISWRISSFYLSLSQTMAASSSGR